MKKKVIIIGGGVSGLAAGIYALSAGFDVDLYESHSIAGGMCTGWRRKGYNIDGCIHWMMGTSKASELYTLWERCGALTEDTAIINHDVLVSYKDEETIYHLYCDTDRMEKELLRIAPEDTDEIMQLASFIRSWSDIEIIPSEKPFDMMKEAELAGLLSQYSKAQRAIEFGSRYTINQYAGMFKSPIVRKLLLAVLPTTYNTAGALFTMLATRASGNGGWPVGGSQAVAGRMAERFALLGGNLFFKSEVTEIIIEGERAVGIRLADSKDIKRADYIIPAVDADVLLNKLLRGKYFIPYYERRFRERENYPLVSGTIVSFGVDTDLSHRPHSLSFETKVPLYVGGEYHATVIASHYCYDTTFSPVGKSTVEFLFNDYNYDYWYKLKAQSDDLYRAEKERLAGILSEELQRLYPETQGRIEMADVCTPLTFNRYCNAYKGAYMSFITTANGMPENYKGTIDGINNLFMAGQFAFADGGLPQALTAGKFAVQRLCHDLNVNFNKVPGSCW